MERARRKQTCASSNRTWPSADSVCSPPSMGTWRLSEWSVPFIKLPLPPLLMRCSYQASKYLCRTVLSTGYPRPTSHYQFFSGIGTRCPSQGLGQATARCTFQPSGSDRLCPHSDRRKIVSCHVRGPLIVIYHSALSPEITSTYVTVPAFYLHLTVSQLTGEDSYQIATMGVPGLRVEIVSDAPPPPDEPP